MLGRRLAPIQEVSLFPITMSEAVSSAHWGKACRLAALTVTFVIWGGCAAEHLAGPVTRLPESLAVYGRLPSLEDVALSPDGARIAFVKTTEDRRLLTIVSPGTALDLTLHTPHGPLTAQGVVVWVATLDQRPAERPIPHGLRFTTRDWSTMLSLGLLLADPP